MGDLVLDNRFDIFVVSETWLSENISTQVIGIPGYQLVRSDREGRGGGVGLYMNIALK